MYAMANATVSILRGTGEDIYGDETDASTAVATGILAQITNRPITVFDPSTNAPRTVRAYRAVLPYGTGVEVTDRVKDESTNDIYTINEVVPARGVGHSGDLRLELERVTQ